MAGLGLVLAEAFSRHFMAVSLLKMHQIFMLAFTGLRVEGEGAQVLVVSQPPPWFLLVFLQTLTIHFWVNSWKCEHLVWCLREGP